MLYPLSYGDIYLYGTGHKCQPNIYQNSSANGGFAQPGTGLMQNPVGTRYLLERSYGRVCRPQQFGYGEPEHGLVVAAPAIDDAALAVGQRQNCGIEPYG